MIGNSQSVKAISTFFFVLFLSGCGGGSSSSSPEPQPQQKSPATISTLTMPSLVVGTNLEASVSYSSSAGSASVKTTVVGVPNESKMLDKEFDGPSFDIMFDAVGSFKLNVSVSDAAGTVNKEFEFTTENNAPEASITGFNKSNLFTEYSLSGKNSTDSDKHSLSYKWSLSSKPEASSLNNNLGEGVDVQFYPDKQGQYTVNLAVSDGYGGENETSFNFDVGAFKLRRLVYNVVDAVYNEALDKVLIVGDDKKLYIYSPEEHETQVVSLTYQGNAVSVLPDGSKAAVGHNGNVSIIDIPSLKVEKVHPIATDVFDIEIATNGYVYAMPRTDQWEKLRAISIENGEELQQTGRSVYAGTVIKMHPSQKSIYGADRGKSPSDIEKYDISGGQPEYLYDSPYHGDYSMCGDLWMSQDGLRIFTKCGNVFRASEIREQDMKYNGKIELEGKITVLSHKGDQIVFVDDTAPNFLNSYSYEVLASTGREELPFELVNGVDYKTEAKFIFHRKDGSVIALVEIDSGSGYLFNHGLVYKPSKIENVNIKPVVIVDANKFVNINELVEISAESSFDPENKELTYSWELIAKPESSTAELLSNDKVMSSFTPDVKGKYEIKVRVNDGVYDSSYTTIVVTAEDPLDKQLISLDFEVLTSVYSKQLNKVIMTASNPSRLVLFDVSDSTTEQIPLAESSSVLSLNPTEDQVAVGFDKSVAIVDLVQLEVTKTYDISADIFDLILPNNGYLYVFPRTGQWEKITTVNLATGEETDSRGNLIRERTRVTLHSSGNYIYGADNGLSPSDIELYDISGGNAVYVYDSPYHGDHDMCGNIWGSDDGGKLFTACGNVFKANPRQSDDMNYSGKLNVEDNIKELSQKGSEIAVVNEKTHRSSRDAEIGNSIKLFEYPSLSFVRSVDIPTSKVNNTEYKNYGVNVFHNSDGGKVIAVVKLDSTAGKLHEHSIFIYSK